MLTQAENRLITLTGPRAGRHADALLLQRHGRQQPVADAFASETPGPIHDRSREHLGTTDTHIVAARHQLLVGIAAAAQVWRDPIHVI